MATMKLKARGANSGSSEITLDLPDYSGPPVSISFDPQYVTEMLRVSDAESVTLEMSNGEKPALFGSGEGWQYLVMPLAG